MFSMILIESDLIFSVLHVDSWFSEGMVVRTGAWCKDLYSYKFLFSMSLLKISRNTYRTRTLAFTP